MSSRKENLTQLLASAGIVTAGKLIGSFTTLGERIIVARLLTPAAYGEVSIGIALLSFGTTIAIVGFSQGVPRYVSRFDSVANKRGAWVSGMVVAGGLALLLTAVLYLNAGLLTETLFSEADSTAMLLLFILALPFVIGMNVTVGAIRGFGNTVYKAYAQDLAYPLLRIVLLAALLYAGHSVLAAGYAYLIAAVISFGFSLVLLHQLMSLRGKVQTHVKEITKFSLPIVVSGVLNTLLTRTDTLMLGYFRSSREVGQYSAAYPIAGAIVIVISSFGFLYLPMASQLDADGEREEIDYIYKTTTKWIYVISFPALVAFVMFPGDVIRIFFGSGYQQGALALAILSLGFFSHAMGGRNRETISALGVTKYLLVVNGAAFGLNIVMNLVLIPRWGITGAAVASAVSYASLNVIACGILMFKYDISPFSRWSIRTFVALPLALLPPLYVVSQYVSISVVTLLPFLVVVGLLSIVVVGLAGGFQPEDAIVLEFVEDAVGVRVPFVRRYLPEK